MKFGLLIIATEILEGKINDLNGRFLTELLCRYHLELHTSLTVRDSESEIHLGLEFLLKTCDVIITSGGLGPTKDDLTKAALANFSGRKIVHSKEAENVARANYDRLQRPYPGEGHVYSQLPEGFAALPNSAGFAPALRCEHFGKMILSAPGVPREFTSILHDHLEPWIIKNHLANQVKENITIKTRRVPEEKIFGEVDPELWDKLALLGEVSSLPTLTGVDIGVKLRARSVEELNEKKAVLVKTVQSSPVIKCVWHWGPQKLEEILVNLANGKDFSYGFAESCTGGLCSHRVTAVPGSSRTFLGSVISYDVSLKTKLLEVDPEIIKSHGVVSVPTAEAMARGLTKKLGVMYGVSTTGIAGPSGGTEKLPVGTVCIAVAGPSSIKSSTYHFNGDREVLKERFSQAALMMLLDAFNDS